MELVELIQKNGSIKLAVVPGPESLHSLVDCLLVPVVEQIRDLAGPVHGLDFELNHFRFVS